MGSNHYNKLLFHKNYAPIYIYIYIYIYKNTKDYFIKQINSNYFIFEFDLIYYQKYENVIFCLFFYIIYIFIKYKKYKY